MTWILEECLHCLGSGWDYCEQCENRCDHDRICDRCDGHGEIPVQVFGIEEIVARLVGGTFSSRRAANAALLEMDR